MTMNRNWGYNREDCEFKTPATIAFALINCGSKKRQSAFDLRLRFMAAMVYLRAFAVGATVGAVKFYSYFEAA